MAGPAFQLFNAGSSALIPFGSVGLSKSLTFLLPILNTGTTDLHITAINVGAISGAASDFVVANFVSPLIIPAGGSDESVSITFTPTSPADTIEQASLTFVSNSTSGTHIFTMTGTAVDLGLTFNASGSPSTNSGAVSQGSQGTSTSTSTATSFVATAVPGTAVVSVTMNLAGNFVFSGVAGPSFYLFQYSIDGGTTWTTFDTITTSSDLTFNMPSGFDLAAGAVSNFNQITLQVICSATVPSPTPGTASVNVTASSINAGYLVSGDIFFQVVQQDASMAIVAPVFNFGNVVQGTSYFSNTVILTNPGVVALTVVLTPDAASGYSIQDQIGSLTLLPNSSSTLTFKIGLNPNAAGFQDDSAAVVITITGQMGETDLEAFYITALIIPAFILQGDQEATVVALRTATTLSFMNAFLPGLPVEDALSFSRQYYVDQPQLNKILNRVWLLYERLGAFTLALVASAVNPSAMPSSSASITAGATNDGLLTIGVFDVQVTGSSIQLSFSLPPLGGVLSLLGWIMKLDEAGEVIENT